MTEAMDGVVRGPDPTSDTRLVPRIVWSACSRCGGAQGQWRGYRHRKDGSVAHRRKCGRCEKWYIGAEISRYPHLARRCAFEDESARISPIHEENPRM